MPARTAPWLALTIVQALLIAWLVVQLAGSEAPAASPPAAATPVVANTPAAIVPDAPAPPAGTATENTPPPPALPASLGAVVHGTVRARGGGDVSGTSVQLFAAGELSPRESVDLPQTASFCWPAIAPGEYRVRAACPGLRASEQSFRVLPGQPDVRLTIELDRAWLLRVRLEATDGGSLRDALRARAKALGADTPWVNVIASPRELPGHVPPPASDGSVLSLHRAQPPGVRNDRGAAVRQRGDDAVLELHCAPPVVVAATLGTLVLAQTAAQPKAEVVTIAVDPATVFVNVATLRAQFVDGERRPLASANVSIAGTSVVAGDDGRIEIRHLRPGRTQFVVYPKNGSKSLEADLAPGGITDLGTVVVQPDVTIHVRFTGVPATPGNQGRIVVTQPDAPVRCSPFPQSIWRGGIQQVQVVPGRNRIRVSGDGGGALDVDTTRLDGTPLVCELAAEASVWLDASGLTEPVAVSIADGELLADHTFAGDDAWRTTLLPGTYTLTLQTLGEAPRTQSLVVPAAGVTFVLRDALRPR